MVEPNLEVIFGVHGSAVEDVVVHEHLGSLGVHRVDRSDVPLKDGNCTASDSLSKLNVELRRIRKRVII